MPTVPPDDPFRERIPPSEGEAHSEGIALSRPRPVVRPNSITAAEWADISKKLQMYFSFRNSYGDVEDLIQEAFCRLANWLENGHSIEGDEGLVKVAFGIARNIRLEVFRSSRRVFLELPPEIAPPPVTPHSLNWMERARYLDQLIERLPDPKDKDLIRRGETTSHEVLAHEYGVPITTLRVWLHRARLKLKEISGENTHGTR
jgi:RNA polymerase sigma factor (sigma-70 family)